MNITKLIDFNNAIIKIIRKNDKNAEAHNWYSYTHRYVLTEYGGLDVVFEDGYKVHLEKNDPVLVNNLTDMAGYYPDDLDQFVKDYYNFVTFILREALRLFSVGIYSINNPRLSHVRLVKNRNGYFVPNVFEVSVETLDHTEINIAQRCVLVIKVDGDTMETLFGYRESDMLVSRFIFEESLEAALGKKFNTHTWLIRVPAFSEFIFDDEKIYIKQEVWFEKKYGEETTDPFTIYIKTQKHEGNYKDFLFGEWECKILLKYPSFNLLK